MWLLHMKSNPKKANQSKQIKYILSVTFVIGKTNQRNQIQVEF